MSNTNAGRGIGRRDVLKMVGTGIVLAGASGVVSAEKPVGAPRKLVLRSKDAANLPYAYPTRDEAYTGQGSWYTTGGKLALYLSPEALGLGSFTVGDIQSLTYHTKKVDDPVDGTHAPNVYVNLYTEADGVDDHGWYGHRLSWEPYYSENLDAPADEWVTWATDSGTNQLTFFDYHHIGNTYGFYGQPTLADLKAGAINWNDYVTYGDDKDVDYAGETVKYITFDTGSGWSYEGYLDAIELVVNAGRGNSGKPTSLRIELEK